jgi:hypothetical protein
MHEERVAGILTSFLSARLKYARVSVSKVPSCVYVRHRVNPFVARRAQESEEVFLRNCLKLFPIAFASGDAVGIDIPNWEPINEDVLIDKPLYEGGWVLLLRDATQPISTPPATPQTVGMTLDEWRRALQGDLLISSFADDIEWEVCASELGAGVLSRQLAKQ